MQTDPQKSQHYVKIGTPDPELPRTQDNALGIDDIGIGEDLKPDQARKPDDIQPDPNRVSED